MIRYLLAGLLLLAIQGAAHGETADGPEVDPQRVTALLEQLSDTQWHTRAQAQEALVALGPAVRAHLQQALEKTRDADVRELLHEAVALIDRADRNRPTLVTIKLENATPEEVLAELSRQAGVEIAATPASILQDSRRLVTLDLHQEPFWLAMTEFCRQARLRPHRYDPSTAIMLQPAGADGDSAPQVMHGGFLIVARSANRSHQLVFSQPQNATSSMSMNFELLAEPKMRVLRVQRAIEVIEALDENGMSLKADLQGMENATAPSVGDGGWIWHLSVPLQYRPQQGKLLKSFRGAAQLLVLDREDQWEVEDPLAAKDLEKVLPGLTYTIREFSEVENSQYRLRFTVRADRFDPTQRDPLTNFRSISSSIRVLDRNGVPLTRVDGGGGGGGGGPIILNYHLTFSRTDRSGQPVGEPAKLVWNIPLEMRELVIPIEFQDLPLP